MANNNVLWCAAFDGALAGSQSGRLPGTTVPATLTAACAALATEVDSLISFDATITSTGGGPILAISGGSNAQIGPELAKRGLLFAIVAAVVQGRVLTDTTPGDYALLATQIVALYSAGNTAQASFFP